jgi:hypothetical protein
MPRGGLLPTWLRRSLEAAIPAAVLAIGTLVARLGVDAEPAALPVGLAGALVLAPPVLGLAVIPIAYPIAFAATRSDAILGAIASFLIAADATVIVASSRVELEGGSVLGMGLLAGLLAAIPAVVGLLASQFVSPVGFGKRAGGWSALVAGVGAASAVLAAVAVGAGQ